MSLAETIQADQQALADAQAAQVVAINAAQAAVDAAQAKLAADQAALDRIQPHLTILDGMETSFEKFDADMVGDVRAAVDQIKNEIAILIGQARALLLG